MTVFAEGQGVSGSRSGVGRAARALGDSDQRHRQRAGAQRSRADGRRVLTGINGGPATSFSLAWLLATAQVGDEVPVMHLRDQSSLQTTITLPEQP